MQSNLEIRKTNCKTTMDKRIDDNSFITMKRYLSLIRNLKDGPGTKKKTYTALLKIFCEKLHC